MILNWRSIIMEHCMNLHALTGKAASAPDYWAWVTTDKPNWDGNYTLSYNHQSTVVGFASSNRPELLLPYIRQRYDWEKEGKRRALRGDINFVTGNRWGTKFKDGIPGILDPITQAPWGNSASEDLYMGMLSGSVWGDNTCDMVLQLHPRHQLPKNHRLSIFKRNSRFLGSLPG